MAEEENNLIELTDEEGNVIKCALYDIIDFEDKQYAILADMSVEEVESALEQITVTTGLSQAVLNKGATEFLLRGDTELSTGISLPFKIISTVFKGLRKGETMAFAMPSNCGKSRLTIDISAYTIKN